jgi:SagB-type dehydrogenase family enzyme
VSFISTERGPRVPVIEDNPTKDSGDDLQQWAANDLRFSDSMRVAVDGEFLVMSNVETGARQRFSKSSEQLLNCFMNWTSLAGAMQQGLPENPQADAVNQALDVIREILQLDILDTRSYELSGARLPLPGGGWTNAMRFLLETRTTRETFWAIPAQFYDDLATKAAFCRQPSAFYERVSAPFTALSDPKSGASSSMSFEEVMLRRRTSRRYSNNPLAESELSKLLYFSWGMTTTVPNPLGDVFVRKTSPSGGSLHPIEVYPIVLNVDGVPRGCYHYSVRRHGLELLSNEDARTWIVDACGDQTWVAEAAVIFVCTAFLPRTSWKYDYSRVARAAISEIGYTGQSAFLTATWLGLGAFTTAALRDEIFENKLGLDPAREPVFSVTGAGALEPDIGDHSRPRKESASQVEGS